MPLIRKVCIIDDDPIFVFGLKRFLKMAHLGFEFIHYPNGKAAIEGLRKNQHKEGNVPDLLLVDLNMPVMDGWQFLEKYRRDIIRNRQLVFIISSSIDPADLKKAMEYPFVSEFILKPITSERLKELVATYSNQED